jgi:RNA polymerase sigma-32 factor
MGEDGVAPYIDLLVDPRPPQDDLLAHAQEQERLQASVRAALARLDRRERYVVERRVMSEVPVSLCDIGEHFCVSSEWARQLELRATKKLRRHLDPLAADSGLPSNRRRSRPAGAARRSESVS